MKKILAFLLASLICLVLPGCEADSIDKELAYENMCNFLINDFRCEDYYIQMSRTKDGEHVTTEISSIGSDCAFFEYDYSGALKFFRNNKLTSVSPKTYYAKDASNAEWTDFSYYKNAETYRSVLFQLCNNGISEEIEEIKFEKTKDKSFPYKISVYYDLKKTDAKKLFNSGGNFGSLSVKFLCSEDLKSFDDISLNVQYDYNAEIYVIAAYLGEPDLPDENGNNGQRPEDIEAIFEDYSARMENSFEEYLNSIQQTT